MSWSHLEEERERGVGRAVGAGRGERAAVRERERVEHALERVLTLSEEPGLKPVEEALQRQRRQLRRRVAARRRRERPVERLEVAVPPHDVPRARLSGGGAAAVVRLVAHADRVLHVRLVDDLGRLDHRLDLGCRDHGGTRALGCAWWQISWSPGRGSSRLTQASFH